MIDDVMPENMGAIASMSSRERDLVASAWRDLETVLQGVPAKQRARIERQVIADPDDRTDLASTLAIYRADMVAEERVKADDLTRLDQLLDRIARDSAEALGIATRLSHAGSAAALHGHAAFVRHLSEGLTAMRWSATSETPN
ncbi:MAG: hypothetical protein ACK5IP_12540 [Paracoccus sp. (in: a-proteobacteria)]